MVIHMPCTSFVDTEDRSANGLSHYALSLRGVSYWIVMKDLCGYSVSAPTRAVVPWNAQINTHDKKTRHGVYHCLSVIHNFSSSRMLKKPASIVRASPPGSVEHETKVSRNSCVLV